MPGIRQPEFPGQVTEDAVMNVPLLATVLLNAVTDPWFALSSGFGTTDFPEFVRPSERFLEPATYFNVSHDYMVASTFTFRMFGAIEFKREHCALSHRSAFPTVQPGTADRRAVRPQSPAAARRSVVRRDQPHMGQDQSPADSGQRRRGCRDRI